MTETAKVLHELFGEGEIVETNVEEILGEQGVAAFRGIKASGNFVLDTLKQLDRPRNALAVGVQDAYRAHESGEDISDAMVDGARKGWNLEEHASAQQLLTKEDSQVKKIVGGMAGDIASDPLTWIFPAAGGAKGALQKAPAFLKAVEGIETAKRAVSESAVVEKIGDSAVGSALDAMNISVGNKGKVKDIADETRITKEVTDYTAVKAGQEMSSAIGGLAKRNGIDDNVFRADMFEVMEGGAKPEYLANMSKEDAVEYFQTVNKVKQELAEILKREQAAGLNISDLRERLPDIEYMPRAMTREAKRKYNISDADEWEAYLKGNIKHSSAQMRVLEDTVKEYHKTHPNFFIDDPAQALTIRKMRESMAIAGKDFSDKVTQHFGKTADQIKGNPAEYKQIKAIGGEDVYFHKSVANAIEKRYHMVSSPEKVSDFIKMFDTAQGWWKSWSLAVRPAYHSRNVVGNMWNAYLAGLRNPKRYGDAAEMMWGIENKNLKGKAFVGKDAEELYIAMRDRGVLGRGQYHNDIEKNVVDELKSFKPVDFVPPPLNLSTNSAWLKGGFWVGGQLEGNARVALFLDQVKKGRSYDDAARTVKKHLFDYSDLSPFEKNVMKRFMPFYTWSRKNIPLQTEMLVKNPPAFNKINIARDNIQFDANVPDPEDVQEYIKDSGPVYFKKAEEKDVAQVFTLLNYHPTMDLSRIANPKELIGGMVTPYLKTPMELIYNYDLFRQRDIDRLKDKGGVEYTDWVGIKMPSRLAHLARSLIMLNELDRLNPGDVFGKATRDEATGKVERTRSFGMDELHEVDVPGVGKLGVGGERSARVDLKPSIRLIQYLTGARPYDVDVKAAKSSKAYHIRQDMAELNSILNSNRRANRSDRAQEVKALIKEYEESFRAENK